jgi:O-6-methylguanine DNA methyltransferase
MTYDFETPLGTIAVAFNDNTVSHVNLPGWIGDTREIEVAEPTRTYVVKVNKAFDDYFSAPSPELAAKRWKSLVMLTQPSLAKIFERTDFVSHVYKALTNDVESGTTVSYRELAMMAGSPGAARAVGSAMRNNDLPIIIPCHRVLKSDGTLGGYMGTSEDGLRMKKWLLAHEGAL